MKQYPPQVKSPATVGRQHLAVVVAGHVDHGKSTLIGRLLADTNNLPDGKLEALRQRRASAAVPMEYAHLLDALKDEQSRGMTIDSARCFFKTSARDYLIIDVPGHVELLQNFVSGAARADAAVLVVDAAEGMGEHLRRQGYMLSMLGIDQLAVCINKMDLVDYRRATFDRIAGECVHFLGQMGLPPVGVAPIVARTGANVASPCARMPWYSGGTVLDLLGRFKAHPPADRQPLRFPVQDIYPAIRGRVARRIIAGRIESGTVRVGDRLLCSPSGRPGIVKSIEVFNKPSPAVARAGQSIGLTLTAPIGAKRGDLLSKYNEPAPKIGSRFRVDLFWLGERSAMIGKSYVLKLATAKVTVRIERLVRILNASNLKIMRSRKTIRPREMAECVLYTSHSVAFDLRHDVAVTSRFVLVADHAIAGGGIIRESLPD